MIYEVHLHILYCSILLYITVQHCTALLYCTDLYGGGGVQLPLYDVTRLAARARGDTGGQGPGVVSPSGVEYYCTVLYSTVLYCTVLYCTVLYCWEIEVNEANVSGGVFFLQRGE